MRLDVAVTRDGPHTRVAIEGTPTLGQLVSLLSVLAIDAAGWPRGDVVLDLAGLHTAFAAAARSTVEDQARRHLGAAGPVKIVWSS